MRRYLAVDCGSTTTKAVLFGEIENGSFACIARSETPTTVEAPVEDVTIGVISALRELERKANCRLLSEQNTVLRADGASDGVHGFYATSSAGGGLQMIVAGVMKSMTAESAERAALGAGAIVADVIAIDDGRLPHERLERIYTLRPDMVLISGGVDGGNIAHVVQLGELFFAAGIRPRFSSTARLPVIFAGNKDARRYVSDVLGHNFDLRVVDNLRPVMEHENSLPAREAIQETFMNHVMLHAPHYKGLAASVSSPIRPTPVAVGNALHHFAVQRGVNLLGVDIGGATTDVFSVVDKELHRTVSAHLGMSYSINNVLTSAGWEAALKLIPFPFDEDELKNSLANKMIRPSSLPETMSDLLIEQVMVRLALRLSLRQHLEQVTELKGVSKRRSISDIFEQTIGGQSAVNMLNIDVIIGSGSALSLAPRRQQAYLMLIDGLEPQGITDLYVDSQFLLPHIGVLADQQPDAAWSLLESEALVPLGVCVAPVGPVVPRYTPMARVEVRGEGGIKQQYLRFGELSCLPLDVGQEYQIIVTPANSFNVGAGLGKPLHRTIKAGLLGVVLDGRGRPILYSGPTSQRYQDILEGYRQLHVYPDSVLADLARRGGGANG